LKDEEIINSILQKQEKNLIFTKRQYFLKNVHPLSSFLMIQAKPKC